MAQDGEWKKPYSVEARERIEGVVDMAIENLMHPEKVRFRTEEDNRALLVAYLLRAYCIGIEHAKWVLVDLREEVGKK